MTTSSKALQFQDRRAQLEILLCTLDREAHILLREPEALPSHLHNMLYLDEGEEGPAGPLLPRAREALAGRPWLRLTNRPPVERSALIRVMEHGAGVLAVAWSCQAIVASAGCDNVIRLWDPATGKTRAILEGHTGPVNAIAFSPDGQTLASGGDDGILRLWDALAGKPVEVLPGHAGPVQAIAFSPDGQTLASGGDDGILRLWQALVGKPVEVLPGHAGGVRALAFSPDGRTLASGDSLLSGSGDSTLRLWDVESRDEVAVLAWDGVGVYALDFSPDGGILAAGGRVVRLLNSDRLAVLRTLEAHTDIAHALAFGRDGDTLVSTGGSAGDTAITLWDAAMARQTAVLGGHTNVVRTLAFSTDGNVLASGSEDGTVRLWNLRRAGWSTTSGHTAHVGAVAFSPDGHTVASGSDSGDARQVRIWNADNGEERTQPHSMDPSWGKTETWVSALDFSPDGRILASGGGEDSVRLWDIATGGGPQVLGGGEHWIGALAFSPQGATLASGRWFGPVYLHDLKQGADIEVLEGHTGRVSALAFSPDGNTLASGGTYLPSGHGDAEVRLWRRHSGQAPTVLPGHPNGVFDLKFSPDGSILASGGGDGTVRLWDPLRQAELAVLVGHASSIRAMAWARDGALLASAGGDLTVRLWNLRQGDCIVVAHCLSPILALYLSADGRILRVADDGAATGNRPIPYLFELCNIEVGPPVEPPTPSPLRQEVPRPPRRPRWAFWRRG